MGALDEFASDVNVIVADLNAQFSVLNDRKLALRTQGNAVAAKWAVYLDGQKAAMTKAEDALNRISNVPLSETPKTPPAGGGLSTIPPKVPGG